MNNVEYLNKTKILTHIFGSKLYGTDTPESDTDITGLFIPTYKYLLGFKSPTPIDLSVVSKDESGMKNNKDAVDKKYDTLQHFTILALNGSPNSLERMFIPENKIMYINEIGREFLSYKHLFVSKNIVPRFLGYANSQKHKMIIKTENYQVLEVFNEFLNKFDPRQLLVEIKLNKDYELFGEFKGDCFKCGDLNINRSSIVKDAKRIIVDRLSKATNRKELILKYGYDTKFASHLIRLLFECIELLETGKLVFPLKDAKEILNIKLGNCKLNEVLDKAMELENKIKELEPISSIPEKPDYDTINDLIVAMTQKMNS